MAVAVTEKKKVLISWDALEDAFENNAHDVHSYLNLGSGEVVRLVDGVAEPDMQQRVSENTEYLRVDPVSSREQYRWMEHFITTVTDPGLKQRLCVAIDGKGAFRRFKDTLVTFSADRERWFAFRSERLRECIITWLEAHGIEGEERPKWKVPTPSEVPSHSHKPEQKKGRILKIEQLRARLNELVESLPVRELYAAIAFLEFLLERKHFSRTTAKYADAHEEGSGVELSVATDRHSDEGSDLEPAEKIAAAER